MQRRSRKGKRILIAFTDNGRYSSLILCPNWPKGSYLKVPFNVLFCTMLHEIQLIYLVLGVEVLPMHDVEILCFDHLENIVSLSYEDLSNADVFYSTTF